MITQLILNLVYSLTAAFTFPFTLLSDVEPTSDLANALFNVQEYLGILSPLWPFVSFFAVMAFVVLIEVAIFMYKGIMWILKKIPGIS